MCEFEQNPAALEVGHPPPAIRRKGRQLITVIHNIISQHHRNTTQEGSGSPKIQLHSPAQSHEASGRTWTTFSLVTLQLAFVSRPDAKKSDQRLRGFQPRRDLSCKSASRRAASLAPVQLLTLSFTASAQSRKRLIEAIIV